MIFLHHDIVGSRAWKRKEKNSFALIHCPKSRWIKKKEEEVYGSMFQYICEKHFVREHHL
jgi:hypothetical protein